VCGPTSHIIIISFDDFLDDTNGNGLLHVTDGESAERRVSGKSFNAHGLSGNHTNQGGITRFDELGLLFDYLSGSSVDF
jgi:hypothetical protein